MVSILLTLVEGVHLIGFKVNQRQEANYALDSILGEYNKPLWDRYGILGLDLAYGGEQVDPGELERRLLMRLEEGDGDSLYERKIFQCALASYGMLADASGEDLIRQAGTKEIGSLGQAGLDQLIDFIKRDKEDGEAEKDLGTLLQQGKEALEKIPKAEPKEKKESEEGGEAKEALTEERPKRRLKGNPIHAALAWKEKALLAQVLPKGRALSEGSLEGSLLAEHKTMRERVKEQSKEEASTSELSWREQSLFCLYLREHFLDFSRVKEKKEDERDEKTGEQGGIAYEMEYLLSGKDRDSANLEAVVLRILALREMDNSLCLMQDGSRMAQVEEIALLLAGIGASPILLPLIKGALVAAWAYLESILDLRRLLSGGKVALLKKPVDWNSDLYEFPSYLDNSVMAKEVSSGIDYGMYQMALLLLQQKGTLALRAMDLMEMQIRKEEGYEMVRMDHMISRIEVKLESQAKIYFATLPMGIMDASYRQEMQLKSAYQ